MKYKVIKSKRRKRTYSININSSGQLVVRVPVKTSDQEIEKFIQQNHNWIQKKLNKLAKNPKSDNHVYYLGQKYLKTIKPHSLKRPKLKFEFGEFVFYTNQKLSADQESTLVNKFYKKQAEQIIPKLVEKYTKLINKNYNTIRYKNIKTRWGSCSSKKNLNFSIHLIKTPIDCVEYVVAHEVCHLKHQNHSRQFWDLVEQVFPNYKDCEKHLKQNQHLYN